MSQFERIVPNFITVSEASRRLGKTGETIKLYLRKGSLPGRKIGSTWYLPDAEIPVVIGAEVKRRTRIRQEQANCV